MQYKNLKNLQKPRKATPRGNPLDVGATPHV